MGKEKFEQELRNHFQDEVNKVAPANDWWNKINSRLEDRKRHSFWFRTALKTRLAWALIPLVILLVGGTVYGATTGVKKLFEGLAGDVEKQGLAQALNLSQTIDGTTVTLERAYADSNVVLIGYSVSKPIGQVIPLGGTLTTADGRELNAMMGMVGMPDAVSMGFDNRDTIFAYDASIITDSPAELSFTLDVGKFILSVMGEDTQKPAGPFIFNFTLPFHSGKIVNINETVEAVGVPVTLEKVVITPYATRIDFGYESPESDIFKYETHGSPLLSLSLPDGSSEYMSMGRDIGTPSASYIMGDFSDKSGDWTVKINELKVESGQSVGPWVFHFQVP